MKRLIEIFANQRLFGDLLTLCIIGLGFVAFFEIRREVFPNIAFDIISVTTVFPGASAEEVEQLVTNPLERDLKDVDGIKKMTSTSVEGRSLVLMQLDVDTTDVEKAKSDIRDVVDSFSGELPENAERPVIRSVESKQTPLIEVSVSGDLPPMELREVARSMEKELEKVRGVAAVKPVGMNDREVHVEVSLAKLARYRVTLEEVTQALRRRNIAVPGGVIEGSEERGNHELTVRTSGQFKSPEEVAATVIRANELAVPIRLSDLATVRWGLSRPAIETRTDGLPSIRLTVLKKEKADAIDLVDEVDAKLTELRKNLDPRVKLTLVNDASEFVRRRLGVLLGNFSIGLGLVLLLLPMFLPFRFSLLIAVGEPFAFLGTILAFHAFDTSLNLVSIIGLIIVSGILVDDGIVVVENVARLIGEGKSPKEAAIVGTQQVALPIFASTATTMMAFLPLATMSGIFGKFVQYIPLGVIVPILISIFENFFIMPHHIGAWLRPQDFDKTKQKKTGIFPRIRKYTEAWWEGWFMPTYLRWLGRMMRRRYTVVMATVLLMVGCLVLAVRVMKIVLFPPEQVEIFMIRLQGEPGVSLDGTSALLKPIEAELAKLPPNEIKNQITLVGMHQQDVNDPLTKRGTEYGQIMVYLTPESDRDRTAAQIIDSLRAKLSKGYEKYRLTFSRINTGPPVGKPVSVGIRSREYETILPAVQALKALVKETPGVTDVEDNYILGKRQLDVSVKQEQASAAGLSVANIGSSVRAAYEGLVATSIQKLDEEIEVRVFLEPELRSRTDTLMKLQIPNNTGSLIPLSAVASVGESQPVASRFHEANEREVRVYGEVDTKVTSASEANDRIRARLGPLREKFPGVTFHFGGEDEDTQESLQSLAKAFGLAVIGIFFILLLTFRTLLQPLVILITIPLGLISVILAFFVHGMPLSFLGMVGMVGLSGIIVNNAIVFVDFVNEGRRNGKSEFDSLMDAARQRARPIFLTTITTVIGIMPTAYGIGGLDKFVVPVAMAMGWGLMFGSILTLFLLPPALAVIDDVGRVLDRGWLRLKRTRA